MNDPGGGIDSATTVATPLLNATSTGKNQKSQLLVHEKFGESIRFGASTISKDLVISATF
jgi:hypothetical protein